MEPIRLNTIEEAIADFKEGNFVIVVDDEDRENEGDFIIAAEKITPEKVNFMLTHGRGVLCAPITEERCVSWNWIAGVVQHFNLRNSVYCYCRLA